MDSEGVQVALRATEHCKLKDSFPHFSIYEQGGVKRIFLNHLSLSLPGHEIYQLKRKIQHPFPTLRRGGKRTSINYLIRKEFGVRLGQTINGQNIFFSGANIHSNRAMSATYR